MKNLIFILVVAVFAYAKKKPYEAPSPTPQPTVVVDQGESGKPRYTFKCDSTCTKDEVKRLAETEVLIQKFIDSKCFDEAWLSFKRLEQTNGLKNQGIIDKVRSSSVKNIPIIFYWPTWRQSKNVIGYTYEGSPEIYLNRNFRLDNTWTVWSEASNLFHETLHKIGFDHDYNATERRPYSIPYRGNRAVEMCEGKI